MKRLASSLIPSFTPTQGVHSRNPGFIEKHRVFARRQFLQFAGAAAAAPALPRLASALEYPSRPVRLIAAFPAGGTSDIIARLIGQRLSDRLGQPVVVENRPGAAGNIGTEAVVRAAPDGYTLLLASSSNAINATLYDNLNFNFIRDIAPVASIVSVPHVLEVNPSVPVKTVPELITYTKSNPDKINMASSGNGSVQHIAGELFKMLTGADMVHVPYRGSTPALTELLAGRVQVMFDLMSSSIEYIRSSKLRPLAVTTAARSEVLPDLPAVADFVPGYEASSWQGIGVPRNTPAEIVDKLNREINTALTDPNIRTRLTNLGGAVLVGSASDFGKLIAAETEKWAKVVKFCGAKLD
jgi:tripartite-type tricarboxylate transporter receptor subunit TctC